MGKHERVVSGKICSSVLNKYSWRQRRRILEAFKAIWHLEGRIDIFIPSFDIDRYNVSPEVKMEIRQKITSHGNIAYKPDLLAASMIEWLLVLLTNYQDVRINISNNIDLNSPEILDSNIISLCGPGGSPVTKRLMETLRIESPFSSEAIDTVKDGRLVSLNLRGRKYTPQLDARGEMLSDYGVIYKRQSPFIDKKRYIYIFAGGRAYATQAAAAALVMADIVYEVFCKSNTPTDEFTLPVEVCSPSSVPLFRLEDEMLVCVLEPHTKLYRNQIQVMATISQVKSWGSFWSNLRWSVLGKYLKIVRFARYLVGYRTAPLLQIGQGLGSNTDIGVKDFAKFLLGSRAYVRISKTEE